MPPSNGCTAAGWRRRSPFQRPSHDLQLGAHRMQPDQQPRARRWRGRELVARTLRALKDKDLVALTWAGSGQSRGEACPDIRAATQARAGRASTGHRVIAARAPTRRSAQDAHGAISASQGLMEWCAGGRTGDDGSTQSLGTVIDFCYSGLAFCRMVRDPLHGTRLADRDRSSSPFTSFYLVPAATPR